MATAAPGAPPAGIDFGRAFTYVGEDPEWLKKILIGGAFFLACSVLVGVPFVLGYFSRTLRNVVADAARPLPEWDDLGGLFEEGLRLTAVYLLYGLGVAVVLGVVAGVVLLPLLVGSSSGQHDVLTALGALGIAALYGIGMLVSLALAIYLPAALARTALSGSIGDGFAWREIIGFIRENPANYALTILAYLLASLVGQLGILLCCVGIFPAAFWAYMVLASALGQTARLSRVAA
jgi:hypothetical protein